MADAVENRDVAMLDAETEETAQQLPVQEPATDDVERVEVTKNSPIEPSNHEHNAIENNEEDESESESESSSDDEPVAPLATNREKRANAGNRLAKLLSSAREDNQAALEAAAAVALVDGADADEETLERAVFGEVEDDEDFASGEEEEGKEGSDGDDMSSSSSDDEDEGEEGEDGKRREAEAADDDVGQVLGLEGKKRKRAGPRETLLQKTMRLKRVKYNLPGPSPLAGTAVAPGEQGEQQTAGDTTIPPPGTRPSRRKAEKLATVTADVATRASMRKATKVSSQITAVNSKVAAQRRKELLVSMAKAEEKKRATNPPKVLTQEERLAQAAEVEKQNAKSLNRFEESEKRRVEDQRAKLEALKNRKLSGPVITTWTGPSVWFNEKLKQVGKSRLVEEIEAERDGRALKLPEFDLGEQAVDIATPEPESPSNEGSRRETPAQAEETPLVSQAPVLGQDGKTLEDIQPTVKPSVPPESGVDSAPESTSEPQPVLELIEAPTPMEIDGAVNIQPTSNIIQEQVNQPTLPSGPGENPASESLHGVEDSAASHPVDPSAGLAIPPPEPSLPLAPPKPPPAPIIRSLAERSLITLSSFPNLPISTKREREREREEQAEAEGITDKRHYKTIDRDNLQLLRVLFSVPPSKDQENNVSIDPISHTPAPEAPEFYIRSLTGLPDFKEYDPSNPGSTRSSVRYLSKREIKCPISGLAARYRDPGTGIPYGSSAAFKSLRRIRKGNITGKGGVWSDFLQAWVGESRPAKGVPEEVWFGKPEAEVAEVETEEAPKQEDGAELAVS
jgi:vacuolar protein sorting-associated protein 72